MRAFGLGVGEQLQHYVYVYSDPRDGVPFYVGKGKGNRVFAHLSEEGDTEKIAQLDELRRLGLTPRIDLLRYGLTESEALLVEASAIDLLGIPTLTNRVRGHGTRLEGRIPVVEVDRLLGAQPVDITDPALLININREYRFNMSDAELYDATRSSWRVGARREKVELVLAVFRQVVREVYRVESWHPGGTTERAPKPGAPTAGDSERWEFTGVVAEEPVRSRYLGRSVNRYAAKGSQNPVRYVNC